MPVELVNIRLTASKEPMPVSFKHTQPDQKAQPIEEVTLHELGETVPVFKRADISQKQALSGPVIIVEPQTTVYVAPRWRVSINGQGGLLLERMDIK